MKIKTIVSIIFLAIIAVIGWKELRPINQPNVCHDKQYQIPMMLKSGEQGTINLIDNHCELPPIKGSPELSFQVLADGSLQNTVTQTKLYFWLRNAQLTNEDQIKSILEKYFHKHDCLVKKNQYLQHDNLITYGASIEVQASKKLSKDYCLVFGTLNDFSSEIFLESNNVLLIQHQENFDGIEPFNVASLKFIKN